MSHRPLRTHLSLVAPVVAAILLAARPAATAESHLVHIARDAGLGLGAAACTAIYAPVKTFIGGSGIIVAASAWALTGGQRDPAMTIAERTLGGDWIVTQQHLRGERDFTVLGRDHEGLAKHR
jgi:hypothetical protein